MPAQPSLKRPSKEYLERMGREPSKEYLAGGGSRPSSATPSPSGTLLRNSVPVSPGGSLLRPSVTAEVESALGRGAEPAMEHRNVWVGAQEAATRIDDVGLDEFRDRGGAGDDKLSGDGGDPAGMGLFGANRGGDDAETPTAVPALSLEADSRARLADLARALASQVWHYTALICRHERQKACGLECMLLCFVCRTCAQIVANWSFRD